MKAEPRKGAVVTILTPEELADIYEIRATLEAMATRAAIPNLSDNDYSSFKKVLYRSDGCPYGRGG